MLDDYGNHRYTFKFDQEATRVPLITMKDGGFYGVEFSAPDNYEYTVQIVAVVPPSEKPRGDIL